MAAESVGQIGLDLVVNKNQFNKQMSGIQSLAKKAGAALASAFAVKKLVDFGKQCVELGSDLQEVQNVVDVTFPKMSEKVNEFSKSAAASFGLSETMAKKFTGTFGSMAKAFGFSEEQAYEMGTTLTGLAGDVASFYNLTQDEAYTKLKSVFTGETESLKDLGVVMTQTALDSYALANGFGKTTKNMSEAEKVALRYAFVQDQLSAASGDFTRTSDGWANQVRVLNLQFDSLKATLGQGLINLFTPVLKVINTIIGKLGVLAESFKGFTELITGNKSSSSGIANTAEDVSALEGNITDVGDAAEESAKKIKGLAGIDELNTLGSSSNADSESTTTGTLAGASGGLNGEVTNSADSVMGSLDGLQKKLEEIANWTGFKQLFQGIQTGIKKIDFSAIKNNFTNIFGELKPIADSTFNGIGEIARSAMNSVGMVLGGLTANVGKEIEIASGGVSRFLEEMGSKIARWTDETATTISSSFDNLSLGAENIFGSFWSALDNNQEKIEMSISNTLTSFSNMGMTIGTIYSDIWESITQGFADFSVTHQEDIDSFFNGIMESATLVSDAVANSIGGMFETIGTWWEEDGKRVWDEIVGVFFDVVEWVTKIWIEIIKPIIDNLSKEIDKLWEKHLQPLWEELLKFFTSVWDLIKVLWDKWLKPIVDWIIEYVGPYITNVVNSIARFIGSAIGMIIDVIKGIVKALRGIIDFVTGVFTGDWEKAWEGIKTFFSGIWDAIWGAIKGVINMIIEGINTLWSGLYSSLRSIVNGVGKGVEKLGKAIGKDWGFSIPKKAPTIPRLAEGGYVKANTPQLAMIGDNLHQGEIVSPENKLEDMALKAAQLAAKQQDAELMKQALLLLKQQNELLLGILEKEVGISETDLFNSVRKSANSYVKRTGTPAFDY